MSIDARQFDRKSTKLIGHVSSPADHNIQLSCEIINLSAGGAKLKISKAGALTGEITLKIGDLGPYRAGVIWTRPPHMGVKFLESSEMMADVIMAVALYR